MARQVEEEVELARRELHRLSVPADRAGDAVEGRQAFLTALRALTQEFPRHAAMKHLLHVVSGLRRSAVRPPLDELSPGQIVELETRFDELRRNAHV